MKSYNQIDMRGKIYSHALEERDTEHIVQVLRIEHMEFLRT